MVNIYLIQSDLTSVHCRPCGTVLLSPYFYSVQCVEPGLLCLSNAPALCHQQKFLGKYECVAVRMFCRSLKQLILLLSSVLYLVQQLLSKRILPVLTYVYAALLHNGVKVFLKLFVCQFWGNDSDMNHEAALSSNCPMIWNRSCDDPNSHKFPLCY